MTVWYAIFGGLVSICAIGLLLPLAWKLSGRARTRAEAELALQRNRLEQVREDISKGLLRGTDATESEAEIGRALLRAAHEVETAPGPAGRGGLWPVATLTVLCLGFGVAVYAGIGSFGEMDMPLASRDLPASTPPTMASDHNGGEIRTAITSLRERLAADPTNAENWSLLARSLSAVGEHGEAASAYTTLIGLAPFDLEVRGNYAETLVRASNGLVTGSAIEAFEVVLAHEPKDPRARYYIALGHAQAGRDREAAEGWAAIVRDAPPGAPYLPAIRKILDALIEDAGIDRASLDLTAEKPAPERGERGPTAADMANAARMSDDERQALISSMVARLEERLTAEPGDVEGWLRLARAKVVLGDRAAAIAALEKGMAANPEATMLAAALKELTEN